MKQLLPPFIKGKRNKGNSPLSKLYVGIHLRQYVLPANCMMISKTAQ